MALAWVVQDPPVFAEFTGQKGWKRATVQFDTTYPAGGEAFVAADIGLATVTQMQLTVNKQIGATTANYCSYDKANSKIQLFESGASGDALIETNLADSSAVVVDVLAYGKLL